MERKIGEIFEVNGRKYRVEECGAENLFCEGCVFDNGETCGRPMAKHWEEFLCGAEARTDHKQVIFREVQETEVPKKENGIAEKTQGPLEVVAEMTMPDRADVPVGKGVKINGRTYMCEESISGCRLCALRGISACEAVQCAAGERADRKEVIFTEVLDKPADKPFLIMMEYAVGEIFERNGVKYECVEEKEYESCKDCAFHDVECGGYICQFGSRGDRKAVIFKRVGEKVNPEPEEVKHETDVIETAARKINSLAEGELQALDGQRAQNAFDRISELAGEIIKMCGDFKKE